MAPQTALEIRQPLDVAGAVDAAAAAQPLRSRRHDRFPRWFRMSFRLVRLHAAGKGGKGELLSMWA